MKKKEIKYSDLDIWLKILVVYGFITLGIFALGFVIGILEEIFIY